MTQDSIKQSVSRTTFKPEEHSYIHNDDAAEGGGCVVFLLVSIAGLTEGK